MGRDLQATVKKSHRFELIKLAPTHLSAEGSNCPPVDAHHHASTPTLRSGA